MMLACITCGKPVLLLTSEQAARLEADPARYAYLCWDCERERR